MAKKKKRKNKKQQRANVTIIIMLVIIFAIIGFFIGKVVLDDLDLGFSENPAPTTTETQVDSVESDYYSDDTTSSYVDNLTEIATDAETTTQESETQAETLQEETLPVNVDNVSVKDKIISHYTDFLGLSSGDLYINDSEITENGDIYTYTLRTNKGATPNKLVGDVKVDIGSGDVTDSMGTENWNIND